MSAKRRGPEGAPPGDRLWGGGFRQPLDPEVRANRAWVEALAGAGLLSASAAGRDRLGADRPERGVDRRGVGGAQQARTGERLHPGAVGADLRIEQPAIEGEGSAEPIEIRIERLAETASPEPIAGRGTLGAPPFRAHRPASRGRVRIGSAAERGASRAVSSIPAPSTPAPRVDRPNRRMNPAASRGSYSSPITK